MDEFSKTPGSSLVLPPISMADYVPKAPFTYLELPAENGCLEGGGEKLKIQDLGHPSAGDSEEFGGMREIMELALVHETLDMVG